MAKDREGTDYGRINENAKMLGDEKWYKRGTVKIGAAALVIGSLAACCYFWPSSSPKHSQQRQTPVAISSLAPASETSYQDNLTSDTQTTSSYTSQATATPTPEIRGLAGTLHQTPQASPSPIYTPALGANQFIQSKRTSHSTASPTQYDNLPRPEQTSETTSNSKSLENRVNGIPIGSTEITQDNFSFGYKVSAKDDGKYTPRNLQSNEEVVSNGRVIPTEPVYLEDNTQFRVQNEHVYFDGEKLFRVAIALRNGGYMIVGKNEANTLRLKASVPYSMPIKAKGDGEVKCPDEIKFSFPGEFIEEELIKFNNDLKINVEGYSPKELFMPIHDRRFALHFQEGPRQGEYIIGKVEPSGIVQILVPGKIRKKASIATPTPTPVITPKPKPTATPTPSPTPTVTPSPIPGTITPKHLAIEDIREQSND